MLLLLRRMLRLGLAAIRLIARQWRLCLTAALLGTVLFAGQAAAASRLWASEGSVTLRPLILREGHLLSTAELTANHALRLREQSRVARVLGQLGFSEAPEAVGSRVTTQAQPQAGRVHLRVAHPDPARAEAIARALLLDFQQELEAENRTRQELDRLVLSVSPTSFARPVRASLLASAVRGLSVGLGLGVTLALLRGWLLWNRVVAPLEAEQLTGAPTLGAIPRR